MSQTLWQQQFIPQWMSHCQTEKNPVTDTVFSSSRWGTRGNSDLHANTSRGAADKGRGLTQEGTCWRAGALALRDVPGLFSFCHHPDFPNYKPSSSAGPAGATCPWPRLRVHWPRWGREGRILTGFLPFVLFSFPIPLFLCLSLYE